MGKSTAVKALAKVVETRSIKLTIAKKRSIKRGMSDLSSQLEELTHSAASFAPFVKKGILIC